MKAIAGICVVLAVATGAPLAAVAESAPSRPSAEAVAKAEAVLDEALGVARGIENEYERREALWLVARGYARPAALGAAG